ncbi:hypothetical protein ACLKZ7_19375, partial [Shewanella algae]|uniref:hypothetical protein n=1 Tax=Shewanella algae TaxID=38313 RepID=UPI00398506C5
GLLQAGKAISNFLSVCQWCAWLNQEESAAAPVNLFYLPGVNLSQDNNLATERRTKSLLCCRSLKRRVNSPCQHGLGFGIMADSFS